MTTQTRAADGLLAELAEARAGLKSVLDGIPESDMTQPVDGTWSVKDMLAHIASWDELGATDLARAARGHVPVLASFKDEEIDDWNASLMRGRTLFSLPQALYELEDRRTRLVETLQACPEDLVAGPLVARLCEVIIEHDGLHAKEIGDWRRAAGGQA
jgi:hypothetical protein